MPRAIWKANITFGPVNVPVKLYSSTENLRIGSHMLHDEDKVRLKQKMVFRQEDVIVERDDMVKGYEVQPGEYVVVDPDELDELNPEASRDIEVEEFVTIREIDPRYLDRVYYLGSDSSDQVYVNFAEALKKSKTAGICRWTMRNKAYLGILQSAPREGVSVCFHAGNVGCDLEGVRESGDAEPIRFSPERAISFVKEHGDIFREVLTLKQTLTGDLGERGKSGSSSAGEAKGPLSS